MNGGEVRGGDVLGGGVCVATATVTATSWANATATATAAAEDGVNEGGHGERWRGDGVVGPFVNVDVEEERRGEVVGGSRNGRGAVGREIEGVGVGVAGDDGRRSLVLLGGVVAAVAGGVWEDIAGGARG